MEIIQFTNFFPRIAKCPFKESKKGKKTCLIRPFIQVHTKS